MKLRIITHIPDLFDLFAQNCTLAMKSIVGNENQLAGKEKYKNKKDWKELDVDKKISDIDQDKRLA